PARCATPTSPTTPRHLPPLSGSHHSPVHLIRWPRMARWPDGRHRRFLFAIQPRRGRPGLGCRLSGRGGEPPPDHRVEPVVVLTEQRGRSVGNAWFTIDEYARPGDPHPTVTV